MRRKGSGTTTTTKSNTKSTATTEKTPTRAEMIAIKRHGIIAVRYAGGRAWGVKANYYSIKNKPKQIRTIKRLADRVNLLDYDTGNGQQDRARGGCWFKAGAVGDPMTPLAFNLGRCKGHKQGKREHQILELVGKVGIT